VRIRSLVQACDDPEILIYVLDHLQFDFAVFGQVADTVRRYTLSKLLNFEWGPGGPPPALRVAIGQRQFLAVGQRQLNSTIATAQRREQQTVTDGQGILFQTELLRILRKESHDTPDVLRAKLRDENPLFRQVAIQVIAWRRLPLEQELIERLGDPDVGVQQMARQTLVLLGRGTDFGPVAGAGKRERDKAVEKWTSWLALQREATPATIVHRISTEADKALSLSALQAPALAGVKDAEDARIAGLSNLLVKASGAQQDEVLHHLQTAEGEHHTQALVRAISQLTGDARDRARQALAERMARLSTSALHDRLHDESAELRRAAAKACAIRGATTLVPDLRRLVEDADAEVAKVARAIIAELARSGP
jgi:hypothetical protein